MDANNQKKTIFILGCGVMQVPAIKLAKKNGWTVVCADQNAFAVGRDLADTFLQADIKNSDLLIKEIEKYNHSHRPVDGVFTCGTDFSLSVARVAGYFNLPGIAPEVAERATDKGKMREAFKENHVNSPWYVTVKSSEELDLLVKKGTVSFPCVVKPADSMGARGVIRIDKVEGLGGAVKDSLKYSRTGKAVIEAYISGPEFSLDAIVDHGEIYISGIADRHIFFPPYFIEMGHTMPSSFPSEVQQAVIEEFKKGIKALGITLGAAKGDIRWDGRQAVVGEIAARLSGGYMSGWTYPYSSGLYPIDAAMQLALGNPLAPMIPKHQKVSAERAFISIPGRVVSVEGVKEIQETEGIENIFLNIKPGDDVRFPKNNVEKCGNVISCHKEPEKAKELAGKGAAEILILLDGHSRETADFLSIREKDSLNPENFEFTEKENIKWFNSLCPCSKFDFWDLPGEIPEKKGGRFSVLQPPCLAEETNLDWQGRTMREALGQLILYLKKSDFTCSLELLEEEGDEPNLFSAYFWQAFLRGSVQGCVWFFKYLQQNRNK